MKNPVSSLAALLVMMLIPGGLSAQADSLENLPNLLIPKFTTSLVKMKSGEKRRAVLNYNLVDQEMVFMQRGQFFVLDDPHLIDTVYMANRTFVPFEKGFYELAVTGPATLFIQHKAYAESLGVPRASIITLDSPKDTEEEAAAVKQAIGDVPFLLVTSASHLPRAMIFFEKLGLHPLPAPANQMAIDAPLNPWERAIPSPMWLMHSDRVGYETLGRLWQWLKGTSGEPGQE